jgi:hypothetical protein
VINPNQPPPASNANSVDKKANNNKKLAVIVIAIITVLLAAVAIYTGIKLYQLSKVRKPEIEIIEPGPGEECEITLQLCPETTPTAIPTEGPSPTPTEGPSATPTPQPTSTPAEKPQPTPTPPPGCWDECLLSEGCPTGLECINSRCANPSCSNESNCVCPAPEIPSAGISTPTIIIGAGGLLLLLLGLLL